MKVLVTGSSGLVGKKIVELLSKQKNTVVPFDHPECDILDKKQLESAMNECEAVIHCAAVLNENRGKETLWETNVQGTRNVANACIKKKAKRLVFLSSVGVYGSQSGVKKEESPLRPETAYEKSKATGEKIVLKKMGENATIVRSALVLGPNPHWKRIILSVQRNFPLIGSGKQAWQTVYYADLAQAAVFLLFSEKAKGEIFIVAGKERPTLLQFTQSIRKELGMSERVQTVPMWLGRMAGLASGIFFALLGKPNPLSETNVKGMAQERAYDISKIEKEGWKNRFSYQKAIRKTILELGIKKSKKVSATGEKRKKPR
jgi:nucleoside-diphosphate-sugar epimerase